MMYKKSRLFFIIISIISLILCACSTEIKTGNSIVPRRDGGGLSRKGNTNSEGSVLPKRTTDNVSTGVSATEPEAPLYEESDFIGEYGSSPGSSYNDGQMTEYLDGQYFLCTYLNENYIVDGKWGYFLSGARLSQMNYYAGRLYGIHYDESREYNGRLMMYDVTRKTATGYLGRKPELMYVVDGTVYYNDADTHSLFAFNALENTEKIIVDDGVYYPIVYSDMIIFSNSFDGGSLYSVPLRGGNVKKLNDRESSYPIVYENTVYYSGKEGSQEGIYKIGLDGGEETQLYRGSFENPVLCGDKLCFLNPAAPGMINVIDLGDKGGSGGVITYDFADELYDMLSRELGGFGTYKLERISNLACVYGKLMFRTYYINDKGSDYYDGSEYDFETGELLLSTMFEGQESLPYPEFNEENPNMIIFDETEGAAMTLGLSPSNGHNYYSSLTAEQAQQADKVALSIAEDILSDTSYSTDLEMINAAAEAVKKYCDRGEFIADEDNYYRSPYGVFIAKKWSSAGSARALGRVLDFMGFKWVHYNENSTAHQYCIVTMDGNPGFADGSTGGASYGTWENRYFIESGIIYKKAQ